MNKTSWYQRLGDPFPAMVSIQEGNGSCAFLSRDLLYPVEPGEPLAKFPVSVRKT